MAWNLDDYEPVEVRLEKFWKDYPDGRIETELEYRGDGQFIVKARVFRVGNDYEFPVSATGYAHEHVTDKGVNQTSALENCETSAIGRALANLGYAAKGKRPSREEMVSRNGETSSQGVTVERPASGQQCPSCGLTLDDRRDKFVPGGKDPAWKCPNRDCQGGSPKKNGQGNWSWASWNPNEFDDSPQTRWAKNTLWGLVLQDRQKALEAAAVGPDIDDVSLGRAFYLECLNVSGQVEPLTEEAAKAVVEAAEQIIPPREPDPQRPFLMGLTLFINKSDSHCECCYRGVNPTHKSCPHCGKEWTIVSSDYAGMGKRIAAMRPDLEPYFPWDDWWVSEAGKRATQELRDLNTAAD